MVNVVGVSATGAGLTLVPLSLGVVLGSVVGGQLVSHFGRYRLLILVGTGVLFLGVLLLSRMTPLATLRQVTLYMAIAGLGIGPSLPLYTLAIQNAVDVKQLGQATSASQFFRQIGGTIGTALLGTVLSVTLAAAFALNLPAGPLGGPTGQAPGSTSDVTNAVQQALAANLTELVDAVNSGDEGAVRAALQGGGVPEVAQAGILQGYEASAGSPQRRAAFLEGLRDQFQQQSAELTRQVTAGVKASFTAAITRVFSYVLVIVVIAWLVTLFLPVLPLRETLDGPAPAT
jgi:MFS family permease